MSDPTLPLIRNCVLISLGTIGIEVSGDAVLVDNQIEATTNILVDTGGIAYVLGDEQTTYSGAGIVEPIAGDRAVWDALGFAARHTNDTDNVAGIHHTQGALDFLYQPIDATLTAIAALADAAGTLTNDGAGVLTWTPIPAQPTGVYNEEVIADGTSTIYYLANYAVPGTLRVYINGILQSIVDDVTPSDIVTFTSAPTAGAVITFAYDVEIV